MANTPVDNAVATLFLIVEPPPIRINSDSASLCASVFPAFVEAAVDRMIPKDEVGPSGTEAGVPVFIAR